MILRILLEISYWFIYLGIFFNLKERENQWKTVICA
jgi:hypothetical protein